MKSVDLKILYTVVANERFACSQLAADMGHDDVAREIMLRPFDPDDDGYGGSRISERLECGAIAEEMDCESLSLAIYGRTCQETQSHVFGDFGYCEICGKPMLTLVSSASEADERTTG